MAAAAEPRRAVSLLLLAGLMAPACGEGPEARGHQIYQQHGCAVCHGAAGHGDGPASGRLDVPPRDFADPRAFKQGAAAEDIAHAIRSGGGAMPPFRDLTEAEAADVAAWIVTLHGRATGPTSAPTVRDAWLRETTASRTTSGAYCTIENPGDAAATLVKVTVGPAADAQLHEMSDQAGIATMRPVSGINIPAHGVVELAPGGSHVMLSDISRPLVAGTSVPMTLTFADGRSQTVQAAVRPLSAMAPR